MLEAHRPNGRFFYGLVMVLVAGWSLIEACPVIADDAAPATTQLSDTVFPGRWKSRVRNRSDFVAGVYDSRFQVSRGGKHECDAGP